jgi:hypothetical protein
MKFSDVVTLAPRLMRREDCRRYCGAPQLFDLMEQFGWIKPTVQRNRMTLFDVRRLDECIDRLNRGEYPALGVARAA